MLCEECHERQANFVISISLAHAGKDTCYKPVEIQLCGECATRDKIHEISELPHRIDTIEHKCPDCGSKYSYSDFKDLDFRLGCAGCYTEFSEELIPLIRRIHGDIIHKGRSPVHRASSVRKIPVMPLTHQFSEGLNLIGNAEAEWMQGTGPDCDVVISTRIRLARNILGYRFCQLADESELQQIAETIENVAVDLDCNGCRPLRNSSVIRLECLDDIDREFLIERHLISRDLAEGNGARRVIVGNGEVTSIMLNEEDHIRLQVINSGLQIRESWETIECLDDDLGQKVNYAFLNNWGYLTACPTNVGTGLRVSVMLHIPALAATRKSNKLLSSISDMGYAIRGMYGEGSQTTGSFYQISNEATLGQSEEAIIDRMQWIVKQIVDQERESRSAILNPGYRDKKSSIRYPASSIDIEDRVFRAYGILKNARIISSKEAMKLLSWVSLGINTGILSKPSRNDITRLLVLIRPAHLQKYENKRLDAAARDISRAAMVRSTLGCDS
jgi:protein arginine kinase